MFKKTNLIAQKKVVFIYKIEQKFKNSFQTHCSDFIKN